jgi:L-ascorbate metabolism protein UlaG (beta-lactamase superfamily)
MMREDIEKAIIWLGHSSMMIKADGKNIFIDPWKLKNFDDKADIILITHPHYDHYSETEIQKISTTKTYIYSCKEVISKTSLKNKQLVEPYGDIINGDIKIKAFPAYNINKDFHPQKNNWMGFIIDYLDTKIYISGDTDFTNEMRQLSVNVAIIPIGGTYTMTEIEAADFVNTIKPDIAIPIHWGDIVGTKENAEKFKSLVKPPTKVVIK